MSQQRSCCCGVDQEFGLECIHGDKLTPYSKYPFQELGEPGRSVYRKDAIPIQTKGAAGNKSSNILKPVTVANDPGGLIRYNTAGPRNQWNYKEIRGLRSDDAPYQGSLGFGASEDPSTSGMGCMLCHGSLIMSFKAKRYVTGGIQGQGVQCQLNPNDPTCDTQITYYSSRQITRDEEQPMHVLYIAAKDLWYFSRGPAGLPYTHFDETPPPYELPFDSDTPGAWSPLSAGGNLGVRQDPFDYTYGSIGSCLTTWPAPPTPTDADQMCYPELTHCTNPANVYFHGEDRPDRGNPMFREIQRAWDTRCGPGNENRTPELADYDDIADNSTRPQNYVCTALDSNSHPWFRYFNEATGNSGCPNQSDQFGSPCLGNYQPGVSSWQMYQCRAQPSLRSLGDSLTYGNGLRVFRTPSADLGLDIVNPALFTNAYAAVIGQLHRVRVWVKADMQVTNGKFSCTSSTGQPLAYHPLQTNKKMNLPSGEGGYSKLQKSCGSGPAVLMYACAGTDIYTSDLKQLFDDGELTQQDLLNIDNAYNNDFGVEDDIYGKTSEAYNKCVHWPAIEQALGRTGKFIAKDWRQDQLNKWDTLENQFKTITSQAIAEGEITEDDADYDAVLQYSQGATLDQSVRDYLTPTEVENDDGTIDLVEHELLPVQKYGKEWLTWLVNRASPKQYANNERKDNTLSEMIDYQATQYLGSDTGFVIDQYDPWHPSNSNTRWKPLGLNRPPILYQRPDGVTTTFEFRYPDRDAYRAEFPGEYDTEDQWRAIVPEWEEKLFEAWYKNNPIYIHSVPGGWSFGGFGDEHRPNVVPKYQGTQIIQHNCMGFALPDPTDGGDDDGNGTDPGGGVGGGGAGLLRQSDEGSVPAVGPIDMCSKLESAHQYNWDEFRTSAGAALSDAYTPGDPTISRFDVCDAFPNYAYMVKNQAIAGSYWHYAAQLRNKTPKETCRTVSTACTIGFPGPPHGGGCATWVEDQQSCSCTTNGCSACCGEENYGPVTPGNTKCGQADGCQGTPSSSSQGHLRNCCSTYSSPYAGRSAEGGRIIGKATAGIAVSHPSSVNNRTSKFETDAWNRNNPSQRLDDPSIYGIRCSESGGCPSGFKCCCPGGCDGDCFCIPENQECKTPPCSAQNLFNSPCCETFGSCCYVDEDGKLQCIDNITQEECISRKSIGGLDGTFHKDRECRYGPCNRTIVRGSCFYTDKLLDHQVCRNTTKETCAALSGEFHENQTCSEFPEKIVTGYQTVADKPGVQPEFAGDRGCGRFGFSVNCCTEEIDEDTGEFTRTCERKCLADCDIASGNSRIVTNCESCQPGDDGVLGHCCTLHGYCKPNVTRADCWGIWGEGTECSGETCVNQGAPTTGKIDLDLQYDSKTNWPNLANATYDGIEYKKDDAKVLPNDLVSGISARERASSFKNVTGLRSAGDLGGGGGAGGGGGGGGGSGADCDGCPDFEGFGTNVNVCRDFSALMGLAGKHTPTLDFQSGKPTGGCGASPHYVLENTCVTTSIQVTKVGFRHVRFTSVIDDNGNAATSCPYTLVGTQGAEATCCQHTCNPSLYPDGRNCAPGSVSRTRGIHDMVHAMEVTVYPYKIRCRQTRELGSGFWRCGVLQEYLNIDQIADYAVGVVGVQDWLACHQLVLTSDGLLEEGFQTCAAAPTACGGSGGGGGDDGPDDQDEGGSGGSGDGNDCLNVGPSKQVGTLTYGPNVSRGLDVVYASDNIPLAGAFCQNFSKAGRVRAHSIPFPEQGNGENYLYAPKYGMGNIPKAHCAGGNFTELNDAPRTLPAGQLRDCAEYWQDKILCESDPFTAPPPLTELIFHDYGGLTAGDIKEWVCDGDLEPGEQLDYFAGASAEYVDAYFDDSKNPNDFWLKREFPGLEYIRLFSAGCFDIPNSYGGGRGATLEIDGITYPIGGDFAGTMVINFGSTAEFQIFDETYGAENLSLKFMTEVKNQPEANPIGGSPGGVDRRHKFIAQPSFNVNKLANFAEFPCVQQSDDDEDAQEDSQGEECPPIQTGGGYSESCRYRDIGFLNGRGLTYANVSQGDTGEYTGKVYEFCSFLNVNDASMTPDGPPPDLANDLGAQLKPIFSYIDDNVPEPHYSGLRGPLVLNARNGEDESEYDMTVTLELTSREVTGSGATCGVCYGNYGTAADGDGVGPWALITGSFLDGSNPRIRENCEGHIPTTEVDDDTGEQIKDWWNTLFIPGYSGITTGGALGCCSHETEDPLKVYEDDPDEGEGFPSSSPCNRWQEEGEGLHNNPARTYGRGDCTCNE